MWVRSTMAYRTSFVLVTLGTALVSLLDFVAVLIMFAHVDTLGGFSVGEVALLYGTSSLSLSIAHLVMGEVDRIGSRIRDGSLDAMLVRPVPIFLQVAADRFALRRVGRALQALGVLGWAVWTLDLS
ncbi:transporter, partial [Streptomyces hainanensis]